MEKPQLGELIQKLGRGEDAPRREGRISPPIAQLGGQGPVGTGGRSQTAASAGRTESIGTTIPSPFSLVLPHPADGIFQQGWRSHTPHSITEQDLAQQPPCQRPRSPPCQLSPSPWQTRDGPTKQHHQLTDPPGPQEHLRPFQSNSQSPPAAEELELRNKHRHPLSHRHPPPFQTARCKNKIKKPPDSTEFTNQKLSGGPSC